VEQNNKEFRDKLSEQMMLG